jgi:hypothetical protein
MFRSRMKFACDLVLDSIDFDLGNVLTLSEGVGDNLYSWVLFGI